VFRIDADRRKRLRRRARVAPGMQLLLDYFRNAAQARDELLPRLALP
jgi:hypothetical protein